MQVGLGRRGHGEGSESWHGSVQAAVRFCLYGRSDLTIDVEVNGEETRTSETEWL